MGADFNYRMDQRAGEASNLNPLALAAHQMKLQSVKTILATVRLRRCGSAVLSTLHRVLQRQCCDSRCCNIAFLQGVSGIKTRNPEPKKGPNSARQVAGFLRDRLDKTDPVSQGPAALYIFF